MRHFFLLLLPAFILSWLCASNQCFAVDKEIQEIENKVIEFRESIKSGELKIKSELQSKGIKFRKIDYTVYFDGTKKRFDSKDVYRAADGKILENVTKSRVWTPEAFRSYSPSFLTENGGGRLISFIAPVNSKRVLDDPMIDVRIIGLYPDSFANLVYHSLKDRIVQHKNEIGVKLVNEDADGRRLHRITYEEAWGEDIVWISPTQNFNMTRMERTRSDSKSREVLEIELKEVKDVGWFPSVVKFQEYNARGEAGLSETLTIEVVQFNKPLPKTTWTFRGMGAPKGEEIWNIETGNTVILNKDDVILEETGNSKPEKRQKKAR